MFQPCSFFDLALLGCCSTLPAFALLQVRQLDEAVKHARSILSSFRGYSALQDAHLQVGPRLQYYGRQQDDASVEESGFHDASPSRLSSSCPATVHSGTALFGRRSSLYGSICNL